MLSTGGLYGWLIEVTGLPFDILILVLLAVAGAFAGFVDSIVGGGGPNLCSCYAINQPSAEYGLRQ